ncbi:MAG: hypothetical protein FWG66_09400 [Spirochaetes bacterium]|nr:hypothetical protein [Spirochaetota bacterium]
MKIENKQRLEFLKSKLKQKLWQEEVQAVRRRFIDEIANFDLYFEFVSEIECEKIDNFVNSLPFAAPGRIDMSCFAEKSSYAMLTDLPCQSEIFFCVCLTGGEITINLYTKGKLENLAKTYDDWYCISPYLLFVSINLDKIIFADDNGEITSAQILSDKKPMPGIGILNRTKD